MQWNYYHPQGEGGEQGLGCVWREQGSHSAEMTEDFPAVLTEAAGETVHLAGKAPGSGLSGAGTSFSGPTEWPTLSLTRSLSRSPGSAPSPRLRRPTVRPPPGTQPQPSGPLPRQVESRATPRLPGLPPRQQPRTPRRAPPPRPRAAIAPPPRTPSRFRLRLPRDNMEAGACRPFLLTLLRPRNPAAWRRTGGCACAVVLPKALDLGLEAASEWVLIRVGLWPEILRNVEGFSLIAPREPAESHWSPSPEPPRTKDGHPVCPTRTPRRQPSERTPFFPGSPSTLVEDTWG